MTLQDAIKTRKKAVERSEAPVTHNVSSRAGERAVDNPGAIVAPVACHDSSTQAEADRVMVAGAIKDLMEGAIKP